MFVLPPYQYILELCRSEQLMKPGLILSHLEKIKPHQSTLEDVGF